MTRAMSFLTKLLTAIVEFFATIFSPLRDHKLRATSTGMSDDAARARRQRVTVVIAVVVILGSAVWIVRTLRPGSAEINRAPFVGLGQALARETARVLDGRGRVGVVVTPMHQDPKNILSDQLRAFQTELRHHRAIEISATEVIEVDVESGMNALDLDRLEELLRKHAALDGLVFFVELPTLAPRDTLNLPAVRPKVVALGIGGGSGKTYFDRKLLSVLVGPRQEFSKPATPPKTPQEWFEVYFQVYTPENADKLPSY